ncbi:uncharacterized protein [Bos taurus]|uniref:uncharacterized protein isoform X7 n=1 Tax=Bos taurus TaxID=9913 RepID=UPI000383DD1A|nr:uncharacterized protein LOC101904339 isoform X7 [Bos taurus]
MVIGEASRKRWAGRRYATASGGLPEEGSERRRPRGRSGRGSKHGNGPQLRVPTSISVHSSLPSGSWAGPKPRSLLGSRIWPPPAAPTHCPAHRVPQPVSVTGMILCEARILPPSPRPTRSNKGEVWPAGRESCPGTPVLQDRLWLQPSVPAACLFPGGPGVVSLLSLVGSHCLSCHTFLTKRISQLLGDAAQTSSTPSAITHFFGQSLPRLVCLWLQDGPPSSWSHR